MDINGPYTYRVDEGDLTAAGRLFVRKRMLRPPVVYLLAAIVVCALLLLVLDALEDGAINLVGLVSLCLGIPLALLLPYLMAPGMMRRQFRQSAALRDENRFRFDEEAVYFESSRGNARLPLGELFAWSQTDKLILLHQTEAYFNPVPKSALGADTGALVEVLQQAGVKRF